MRQPRGHLAEGRQAVLEALSLFVPLQPEDVLEDDCRSSSTPLRVQHMAHRGINGLTAGGRTEEFDLDSVGRAVRLQSPQDQSDHRRMIPEDPLAGAGMEGRWIQV